MTRTAVAGDDEGRGVPRGGQFTHAPSNQGRQPAGSPVGGQFTTVARGETGVQLAPARSNSVGLSPDGTMTAHHGAGATVTVFTGDDGALVVHVDTTALPAGRRVRLTLNDGDLFDGDPEVHEPSPGMDPVRAAHEATVRQFIEEADVPDAAASWHVDVLSSRSGHRMSRFVDVRDADGNELRAIDTEGASPEVREAVAALVRYVDPEAQDGYTGYIPRLLFAPE